MSGSGKNNGQIQYFKTENTLNEKKIVFTSGSGGIFKSGIPIGEFNSGEEIKFFSDLSQLTFVKVVSFNKENN